MPQSPALPHLTTAARRAWCGLIMLVALAVTPGGLAAADHQRVALVIGNGAYHHASPLPYAVADARAIRQALLARGFEVIYQENADRRSMAEAISGFFAMLPAGASGILYYSGHAVQIRTTNYLLPIDLPAPTAGDGAGDGINLGELLERLAERRPGFGLAVIDACHAEPLPATGPGRCLAPPTSNIQGLMVVYSAGLGQRAFDRLGPDDTAGNSLFTRELLKAMARPGSTAQEAIRQTRQAVEDQARSVGALQTPAVYDLSGSTFAFTPAPAASTPSAVTAAPDDPAAPARVIESRLAARTAQQKALAAHREALKAEGEAAAAQRRGQNNNPDIGDGYGIYTFGDGERYQGQFRAGKFDGYGSYVFTDGDRYEGEWREYQKHGYGIYRAANGDRYEGEWRDGQKNGYGVYYFADGDRYEGEWRDDKGTGYGVATAADGRVAAGTWANNELTQRVILPEAP